MVVVWLGNDENEGQKQLDQIKQKAKEMPNLGYQVEETLQNIKAELSQDPQGNASKERAGKINLFLILFPVTD